MMVALVLDIILSYYPVDMEIFTPFSQFLHTYQTKEEAPTLRPLHHLLIYKG